jgi:hypothetical protein
MVESSFQLARQASHKGKHLLEFRPVGIFAACLLDKDVVDVKNRILCLPMFAYQAILDDFSQF